jgi:hypothetical protein
MTAPAITANMKSRERIYRLEKEEKPMKKWQITLIVISSFLIALCTVGYVLCNRVY